MTAIDIETIPNKDVIDRLPEPKIDSRIKDPEKIEAAKAKAKDKQIEQMSLAPLTGRVCAWASVTDNSEEYDVLTLINDKQERLIINNILDCIAEHKTIITFNGMEFDLPFLFIRAAILGIKPKIDMQSYLKRYTYTPHCDLRMFLSSWDKYKPGSLDYYARLLFNEKKEELGYDQYIPLIESGDGPKIAEECLQHTRLTYRIYKMFADIINIERPILKDTVY